MVAGRRRREGGDVEYRSYASSIMINCRFFVTFACASHLLNHHKTRLGVPNGSVVRRKCGQR